MAYVWEPTLIQVAGYVPWLTVPVGQPGAQAWLGTFGNETVPTDVQAQRHITDAASLVGPRIGGDALAAGLRPTAATVTALYAAASLARAYPRRGTDVDDLALALAWEKRADGLLPRLEDIADDTDVSVTPLVPVLYAPDPVAWGDDLFLGSGDYPAQRYLFPD